MRTLLSFCSFALVAGVGAVYLLGERPLYGVAPVDEVEAAEISGGLSCFGTAETEINCGDAICNDNGVGISCGGQTDCLSQSAGDYYALEDKQYCYASCMVQNSCGQGDVCQIMSGCSGS
ncbi:MAG TPA: hypothetical protein VMV10_22615 [Pirellulales bacterium]|nr:hypothetical protein [Pirellulales bacterium]